MILYVNGDKHTAGALVHTKYETALDDPKRAIIGNKPHPDNLVGTWSQRIAETLVMRLKNYAPNETNTDIIEATDEWIDKIADELSSDDVFIIIAWNPREEDEDINLIRNYHLYLKEIGINHLFFDTQKKLEHKFDFKHYYLEQAYVPYLKKKKLRPVMMSNKYFGKDGHTEWAIYLLNHLVKHKMV